MPRSHPDELEPLESRRLLAVNIVNGILSGTPGDDVIVITPRGDGIRITVNGEKRAYKTFALRQIRALGGNDRIVIKPDSVRTKVFSIDAGDGDDTVKSASIRAATINGGNGDDRIIADIGRNQLFGGDGNDVLRAGRDNDTLQGGDGDDTLYGEAGDDYLYGDAKGDRTSAGSDHLSGGDGHDSVSYLGRTRQLRLSIDDAANDGEDGESDDVRTDVERLEGGANADHITGSDRDDTLLGNQGIDTIFGLAGNDLLMGEGVTPAPPSANHLHGGDGNDILNASGPGSTASGGAGHDKFNSVSGLLDGGAGDDIFHDLLGSNTIVGGSGNDQIYVRNGKPDTIDGGLGDDLANIDDRGDSHRSIESGIRPR